METEDELTQIDGIGQVMAEAYRKWWDNEKNRSAYEKLLDVLEFEKPDNVSAPSVLAGKTFVVTGSLYNYGNRNELKEYIENSGGKVSGSVSSKTDFLINNDYMSNSSKNKTAKELGVPIITEEEFIERFVKGAN